MGKAGPGAIGEALATGVPLIATSYLPGQETENVTFITEAGIGRYVPHADQLPAAINELLVDERRRWRELAASMARIARPYASLDIAREGLALSASYRASGQASR